jgi:hypothetical protein
MYSSEITDYIVVSPTRNILIFSAGYSDGDGRDGYGDGEGDGVPPLAYYDSCRIGNGGVCMTDQAFSDGDGTSATMVHSP